MTWVLSSISSEEYHTIIPRSTSISLGVAKVLSAYLPLTSFLFNNINNPGLFTPIFSGVNGWWAGGTFWKRQRTTIFDVRITDTSARSYRNTEPQTVIERQEKEKKDKYRDACLQRRMDFTPLVYSVEGIPGRDARGAEKNLARLLSHKWRRPYSQMVQYVRVRMSIAVVRSNSLLIRGSRNKRNVPQPFIESGAAHHGWQMWNER